MTICNRSVTVYNRVSGRAFCPFGTLGHTISLFYWSITHSAAECNNFWGKTSNLHAIFRYIIQLIPVALHVQKRPRLGGGAQSVKKAPNRQNVSLSVWAFLCRKEKPNHTDFQTFSPKKLAVWGVLTYCANRMTTVPLYAYAFGLLVFGAPLTSVSLSKKSFLTDCIPGSIGCPEFLLLFLI